MYIVPGTYKRFDTKTEELQFNITIYTVWTVVPTQVDGCAASKEYCAVI